MRFAFILFASLVVCVCGNNTTEVPTPQPSSLRASRADDGRVCGYTDCTNSDSDIRSCKGLPSGYVLDVPGHTCRNCDGYGICGLAWESRYRCCAPPTPAPTSEESKWGLKTAKAKYIYVIIGICSVIVLCCCRVMLFV